MTPHDYQEKAITDSREAFKQGHKNIAIFVCAGGGKSLIAKLILEMSKGKLGFFSYRKVLIDNIHRYFDNSPKNIDICTLQKIGKEKTDLYDLVIVDEAWGNSSKLKKNINTKYMITLTGSPVDASGNVLDFDYIVEGIQLPQLIKRGLAKKIKLMSTSKVDTSSLKKTAGDFNRQESYDLMSKATIMKDITAQYFKYALGKKVLCFAIDTNHCEELYQEFLKRGVKVDCIHSKKSKKLNDVALKKHQDGEIDILVNVDMLGVGYDDPAINCVMLCRPMCSLPLFYQFVCRATRKDYNNEANNEALILDCCEVSKRTNFHPMMPIDITKTKQERKQKKCKVCQKDMFILSKKAIPKDDYTYVMRTRYKCKCGNWEEVEELKAYNFSFCENCQEQLQPSGLDMKQDNKSITFSIKCECGHRNIQRQIMLTDSELKIIEHEKIMSEPPSWEMVKKMLLVSCKRCGYNHRYSVRIIEQLKKMGKEPKEVVAAILDIDGKMEKISRLLYGYFKD